MILATQPNIRRPPSTTSVNPRTHCTIVPIVYHCNPSLYPAIVHYKAVLDVADVCRRMRAVVDAKCAEHGIKTEPKLMMENGRYVWGRK